MVTPAGVIKLMDFGLAVATSPGGDETRTSAADILGTPAFMAPEQLAGLPLDPRTDIYALACVAFDLLTGRHLCDATNLLDLVQRKLSLHVPPAAEIGDGISGELHAFLVHALKADRNERPASLDALVAWAGPAVALRSAEVTPDAGGARASADDPTRSVRPHSWMIPVSLDATSSALLRMV